MSANFPEPFHASSRRLNHLHDWLKLVFLLYIWEVKVEKCQANKLDVIKPPTSFRFACSAFRGRERGSWIAFSDFPRESQFISVGQSQKQKKVPQDFGFFRP